MKSHLTRNISPYLVLLGLILLLPISFFAFLVPLTPARMMRDSVALFADLPIWSAIAAAPLPIPQNTQTLGLLLIVMTALAFGVYGAAVVLSWGAKPTRGSRLVALIFTAVFWLIFFWALPNINTDIFNFIVRGRLAAVHQSNPYYSAADEFPDDPLYPYASKRFTHAPGSKLPAWMVINTALAWVAGDDPTVNLLLYRGALYLLSGANLLMIGVLLRKLYPQHLLSGILIYAWNPIVIIFSGSKVDTVMAFYLLIGAILLLAHRRILAMIPLALSALTKLLTLPLAAVTLLDQVRLRDWRRLILESLAFGITAILIYLPYTRDTGIFAYMLDVGEFASAKTGESASTVGLPIPLDLILTVGLIIIVLVVGLRQDGSLPGLLRGWAIVMLYFSIFLVPISKSWYFITPITIVSLVRNRYLVALTVVISSASFLINYWQTSFSEVFPSPNLFRIPVYYIYVATILLAGVAVAVGAFLARRDGRNPFRGRLDRLFADPKES
ncbi:MAG: hypothetical protein JSV68_04200 [Anaerolineaceae bacterium]|nr:MAG: hypothetical protein JSV68_04200 [Anaerolineaceae bacterium]